jgi:E3 ubiquitin-protein ligase FANCL
MIALDAKNSEWMGWININEEALTVYARVFPESLKIDIHSIQVDPKLLDKFTILKQKKWFVDRLTHLDSIELLPLFLQESLASDPTLLHAQSQDAYVDNIPQLLIFELDSIGWEHFVNVNQTLDIIKLKTEDRLGFEHQFEVHILQHYPLVAPEITADLPVSIHLSTDPSAAAGHEHDEPYSFRQILHTVQTEINKYEDLFAVLRDLDLNTNILEPSSSSFSIVSRRLAVSRTCSIKVTLDPMHPRELCQITYMGPRDEVMTLRRNFGKNLSKWSSTDLVRLNLQHLLETTFIEPSSAEDLSYLNECGICYSYQLLSAGMDSRTALSSRGHTHSTQPTSSSSSTANASGRHKEEEEALEMATPDQMCLNRKCARLFHTPCLVSWLQAVPTNKTSFGTLFGSCPYCSESISVRTFY